MKYQLKYAFMALGITALAGCNINDNGVDSAVSSTTVSGVAATGAPIFGGNVNLRCGNGVTANAITSSNGQWSTSVPADSLPCYVKVSGGTPAGTFYSIAQTPSGSATTSTANITPLSDLIVAAVVNSAGGGEALDVWFANNSPELRQQVANGIAAAVAQLRTALADAGYDLPPGSFDPLTSAIVAGGAEDLYDLILEAYKQALADAGSSYEDARDDYVDGAGLPEAGDDTGPGDTPDTALSASETGVRYVTTGKVLGSVESNKLRYWAGPGTINVGSQAGLLNEVTVFGPEANSYVNFRNIPDALGTYDCGYGVSAQLANVEIGFAVSNGYNTAGTRTGAGTFSPGFRCSLTITKVGTRSGSNYSGAIEGSFDAQLYKTGQAVNTQDSISVKGHFRIGTPTNDPVTPTASTSLFGKSLKSIYVGNYTLKCTASPGQPVETFSFSIATNGSSTFRNKELLGPNSSGSVSSSGGPESSFFTLSFNRDDGGDYVVLGFKPDGTFYPNSVHVEEGGTNRTLSCFGNAGNVAPATTSTASADLKNIVAAQARTETVDCSPVFGAGSNVKTPTTLTINSDGSAQIGSLSFLAKTLSEMKDPLVFPNAENSASKTASISYVEPKTFPDQKTLAISLGADMKTKGVLYSNGDLTNPANTYSCSPQL
ncbi:hypothetical protein [Stenotrophobium rhamnosiphilum]|uniref:Uncharacterized protein n=1 Tax=Stenotrophobium rhamnosiphilum TaxID=2029166 RepID=A0A2T5MKX3_9GAMM|nr:hypothetical protein [Stenotrophobium rhamnosiphilum]PTU33214.1 hypothetical protein CJD38_03685 [Stenotrophobium rhamnosiphilum]